MDRWRTLETYINYYLYDTTTQDCLLFGLILSTLFLLLLAFLFTLLTFATRFRNMRNDRLRRELVSRWNETLLDVLADVVPEEELHQKVRPKDHLYFVDFLLRHARMLRGEEYEVIKKLAKPYLPTVQKRLKFKDVEQRARAIQTLCELGLEDYEEDILRALKDPSPLVAMMAVRSLAACKKEKYARLILGELHRFDNWSTNYLVSMFASVGRDMIVSLRDILSNVNQPVHVRVVAAESLRELNDLHAGDIAANVIPENSNRDLQAACLRLLAQLGGVKHVEIVRSLAKSEDFVLRAQAVKALGTLGEKKDLDLMEEALRDESPWVAFQASLGLRDNGGIDRLRQFALSNHPSSVFARQVLEEGSQP